MRNTQLYEVAKQHVPVQEQLMSCISPKFQLTVIHEEVTYLNTLDEKILSYHETVLVLVKAKN